MPRVVETSRELMDAAEAEREAFLDPTRWKRSARGNLCREWYGRTVTIFSRRGRWWWCIAGSDDDLAPAQFSRQGYRSIAAAQAALALVVVETLL